MSKLVFRFLERYFDSVRVGIQVSGKILRQCQSWNLGFWKDTLTALELEFRFLERCLDERQTPEAISYTSGVWFRLLFLTLFELLFVSIVEGQILFQILGQLINSFHLITDLDALRTLRLTLFAADAMVSLT